MNSTKTAKRAMAELREVAREIPREEARVLHSEAVDLVVKLEVRHGFGRRKVRRVVVAK